MSIKHDPSSGPAGAPGQAPAPGVRWYLVETEARREILVDSYLTRNGYQTHFPSIMRTVRHARQRRTMEIPFFPGFLFVALDLAGQDWRQIERAPGVVRLLVVNGQPAPAPAGFVEALMALADLEGFSEPEEPPASDSPRSAAAQHIAERLGFASDLGGDERVRRLLAVVRGEVVVDLQ